MTQLGLRPQARTPCTEDDVDIDALKGNDARTYCPTRLSDSDRPDYLAFIKPLSMLEDRTSRNPHGCFTSPHPAQFNFC